MLDIHELMRLSEPHINIVDAWAFAIRVNAIARAVALFGFICCVGLILAIGGYILLEIYKDDNL